MGASNYSIFTSFKAKDGTSSVLKGMSNAAQRFGGQIDSIKYKGQRSANSITSAFQKVKGVLGAIAGLYIFKQIKDFGSQAVKAAEVEIAAQQKLQGVLKNNAVIKAQGNNAYLKVSEDLFNMASRIQQKGVIGDEVLVGGMQTLGSMGFDDKVIKKMIPVIADLAVQQKGFNVQIQDTEQISKQLGRALAGNAGGLSRMGILLSANQQKMIKSMKPLERANYLYNLLSQRVGGLNEQLSKTDQGSKIQFFNNLSDRMEDIGKKIIPIEGKIFRSLNENMPAIIQIIDKFFNGVNYGIQALNPVFKALGDLFNTFTSIYIPMFSQSLPIIKSILKGVVVPSVVVLIRVIEKLLIILKGVYDFTSASFNFIKNNWLPLLLILPATIGGIRVAIDLLRLKMALLRMEGGLLSVLMQTKLLTALGGFTTAIWRSVAALYAQATAFLMSPVGLITLGIVALIGVVILLWKNWDKVTETISVWWQNTKNWLSSFWETCKNVFSKIGTFIKENFVNILLGALGPIGLMIRGIMTISGKIREIKNNGGIKLQGSSNTNLQANVPQKKQNNNGKIDVGVKIDNSTMFPATASLGLMSGNSLSLSPSI